MLPERVRAETEPLLNEEVRDALVLAATLLRVEGILGTLRKMASRQGTPRLPLIVGHGMLT